MKISEQLRALRAAARELLDAGEIRLSTEILDVVVDEDDADDVREFTTPVLIDPYTVWHVYEKDFDKICAICESIQHLIAEKDFETQHYFFGNDFKHIAVVSTAIHNIWLSAVSTRKPMYDWSTPAGQKSALKTHLLAVHSAAQKLVQLGYTSGPTSIQNIIHPKKIMSDAFVNPEDIFDESLGIITPVCFGFGTPLETVAAKRLRTSISQRLSEVLTCYFSKLPKVKCIMNVRSSFVAMTCI